MYIKKHTRNLLEIVDSAMKDKTSELEMIIKETHDKHITNEIFNSTLSRIKGSKNVKFKDTLEMLDISFKYEKFNEIRVTIIGQDNITNYCLTNDIKSIDPNFIIYLKKKPLKFVSLYEYNIRFNLKKEIELNDKDHIISELRDTWTKQDKFFRYKKRITYGTVDNLFNFDLTILKSSNKKTLRRDNSFYKKKDVKDYMKKYVVKPHYIVDFDKWFNELKPTDDIELIGKKYDMMISSKSLQKSNVFDNPKTYEIELEFIGNKSKSSLKNKEILIKMLENTTLILQAIQKSYYIISEHEKKAVIDNYKLIMNDYKFQGPHNINLEIKHILEKKYSDYEGNNTIRRDYTVTDKADGERNLLIILENGDMYLMNRKNTVKKLGANCKPLSNSIFDCEYILKDKEERNINLLMIFDAYFINNKDIRGRIFNRSNEEKMSGSVDESRYEIIEESLTHIENNLIKLKGNNIDIKSKKFYYSDNNSYSEEINTIITDLENKINNYDKDSLEYSQLNEQIKTLKMDTKIFDESRKVYEKEYPYKIDGLIFTPRKLKVGEDPDKEQKNMFDGRWNKCFKWKPPEENTIDFLVKFKKDKENKKDIVTYKTINNKVIEVKILELYIGYNPNIHTRHNSCRVLNENLIFDESYSPVIFQPFKPYVNNIHKAYLPLVENNLYCENNSIILENNIVEFSYDKDSLLCWKPLRVRDTLKPNDFITSTSVWSSIHNPINIKTITSGIINTTGESIYYSSSKKRVERLSKPLNDFHSFVKKDLITNNLLGENNCLDIGSGKGGDLNHFVDAKCNVLVGIDNVHDNLSNIENGMCNRIFSKSIEHKKLLETCLVVWGNGKQSIFNGEAANDELNKFYLDIIYGNITLDQINNSKLRQFYNIGNTENGFGFDLVSIQFAFHYFFENITTLDICLQNISKSLKKGGRFIGTCLDGKKVFEKLKDTNSIGVDNLWKINKLYKNQLFPDNEKSLGYTISVFNESIGTEIDEYLVNFEYLIMKAKDYGLILVELNSFKILFDKLSKQKSYGSMRNITNELKEYSFLNNAFIFEKK